MIPFYEMIISPDDTLKTALERMTHARKGLLFVCDEGAHLVGVVSDGDIRRALVGNALMVADVKSLMNLDPVIARSDEEGLRLLDDVRLLAVPVVDDAGNITSIVVRGIHQPEVVHPEPDAAAPGEVESVLDAIAIIPARGGSKRILRKNLALLAGRPLLSYAIHAARCSRFVHRVLVSTEDQEIADTALRFGAEVPWLRPVDLAKDHVSSTDVLLHAVQWISEHCGDLFKYGLWLEPTAPLRTPEQIDRALELLASSGADSVMTVCEVPHVLNPEELMIIRDGCLKPYTNRRSLDDRLLRGSQAPAYVQNGLVYAFRLESVMRKKSLYGDRTIPLVLPWEYFLDIDTPEDMAAAEHRLKEKKMWSGGDAREKH